MSEIFIELPFPPSVNNMYGYSKKSVYSKSHIKEYKNKVKVVIQKYMRDKSLARLNYPLIFRAVAYEPDNRRRDEDNLKKALYDAITYSKLWVDDSLVRESHFYMEKNNTIKGKVFINISPKTLA
jgi:crossover junction endodeoxyribonuclease RusA